MHVHTQSFAGPWCWEGRRCTAGHGRARGWPGALQPCCPPSCGMEQPWAAQPRGGGSAWGERSGWERGPRGHGAGIGTVPSWGCGCPHGHSTATQRTPKGHPTQCPVPGQRWQPEPPSPSAASHGQPLLRPPSFPSPPLSSAPLPLLSSPPPSPPLPRQRGSLFFFFFSFFLSIFFSHIDAAGGREPARRTARARRWGRGWRQPRSTHGAPGPRRGALGPRLGAPGPHHGANSRGEAAAERRSVAGQPWAIRQRSGPAEGRGKGQLLPRSPPGPLPLPIEHGNAFCFRILYAAAAPSTCCPRPVCPSTRLAPSAEASGGSGLKARRARGPRASSSLQNLGCNKWVLLPELCWPCGHRDVWHVPPRLSVCPSVCPCSRTRCCLGLPGDAALSAGL